MNQIIRSLIPRIVAFAALLSISSAATAQELEPRAYSSVPVGVNFVAVGYAFSQGNILLDPVLPVEDFDARIHAVFARYIRTFSLFGMPSKVKVNLPWVSGHWEGEFDGVPRSRDVSAVGDARIGIETIFWGAPALRKSEFGSYKQKRVFGASLDVIMPTGDYDSTKLVNLGSNRWVLNPEIGFSQTLGKWILEVGLAAGIYGANDEYFGDSRLEQQDFFGLKVYVTRSFRPGFWISLGAGYGDGGATSIDGVTREDDQSNMRIGITCSYAIRPNQGLVFNLSSGFTYRAGPDFNTIAVAYQYSWGGN
jgi:hypothetical protein